MKTFNYLAFIVGATLAIAAYSQAPYAAVLCVLFVVMGRESEKLYSFLFKKNEAVQIDRLKNLETEVKALSNVVTFRNLK